MITCDKGLVHNNSFSFHGDLTEDDEEESKVLPLAENSRQGLEWDDSTLSTGNVSKTYHV